MQLKQYKYWAFTIIMVFLASCEVLDQEPESEIPRDLAIVDAQSLKAATVGLYSTLQAGGYYGGGFVMATELTSGNARAAAFQRYWQELASGLVPTTNFQVEDFYIAGYASVNAANAVLVNGPLVTGVSENELNQALGVAHFVRGLAFFDLLRSYGEFFDNSSQFGVSLPLEPALEVREVLRATVAESYAQIEDDLNTAIGLLNPGVLNKTIASIEAAQAILARVHLYQGELEAAKALASAVIGSANYSLTPNYNAIYTSDGNTSESIFEISFVNLDDENIWAVNMLVSPPEVTVSSDLEAFISDQEERSDRFEQIGDYFRSTKYGTSQNDAGANTIVSRISEMYLIRAEALGTTDLDSALVDINTVRERAGLNVLDSGEITTRQALIDQLLQERRAEFAFEGQYWYDLIRYGKFAEVTGLQPFRRVFPIPQREMNITTVLTQYPGY